VATKSTNNNWFSNLLPAIESMNPIPTAIVKGTIESGKQLYNYAKDVGAGVGLNSDAGQGMEKSQGDLRAINSKLYQKAQSVKDPNEKTRLLKLVKNNDDQIQQNTKMVSSSFSPDVNQNPAWRGFQTGANIAGIAAMGAPVIEGGVNAYKASPLADQSGFINPGATVGNEPSAILDAKGNPMVKPAPPTEMGSYSRDPNTGIETKNPTPQPAVMSQTAETPGTGFTPEEQAARTKEFQSNQVNQEQPSATFKPNRAPVSEIKTSDANDISRTVSPKATADPYGPVHTQEMQDALTRNGVTNYSKAPAAAKKIYDGVINPEFESNPKTIALDDVVNGYKNAKGEYVPGIVKEMQLLNPELDAREAKEAAADMINKTYNISRNTTGNATGITDKSLFDIKTNLNGTTAVKNYYKGTIPTSTSQLAQVAARDSISNIIADLHPNIAQATRDYGLIDDAMPSLFKAYQDPIAKPSLLDKIPGPLKNRFLLAGLAIPTIIGGSAVAAEKINPGSAPSPSDYPNQQVDSTSAQLVSNPTKQVGKIPQNTTQPNQGQVSHSTIISPAVNSDPYSLPTEYRDIDPSKMPVSDPTTMKMANGAPVSISEADHRAQDKWIVDYRAAHPNDITATENADRAQKINNDSFHPDMIKSTQDAKNAQKLYNDAMGLLNNKKAGVLDKPNPLDVFQIGGVGFETLHGGLSGRYKQLKRDFADLGLKLDESGTPDAAKDDLTKKLQIIMSKHNQMIKTYVGNKPSGASGTNSLSTTSTIPTNIPPGGAVPATLHDAPAGWASGGPVPLRGAQAGYSDIK
jgi:hypothetical protein